MATTSLGVTLTLAYGLAALVHPTHSRAADPPAVVVLRLATTNEAAHREDDLVSSLGLALDGFVVFAVRADHLGFASLPLAEQIAQVAPLAQRYRAAATVWLTESGPGQVMLYLVATHAQRTLVRSMEATSGTRTDVDFALALRELLGTAYLFAPPPDAATGAMRNVVDEVRARVVADAVPRPPTHWSLWVHVVGGEGLGPHRGAATELGLQTGLAWDGASRLRAGVGIEADTLPLSVRDGERSRGWDAALATHVGASYQIGVVTWGPEIGLRGGWRQLVVRLDSGEKLVTVRPRLRLSGGLKVTWHVNERLALTLTPGIDFEPKGIVVRRRDDSTVAYKTPWLSARVAAGIQSRLPF